MKAHKTHCSPHAVRRLILWFIILFMSIVLHVSSGHAGAEIKMSVLPKLRSTTITAQVASYTTATHLFQTPEGLVAAVTLDLAPDHYIYAHGPGVAKPTTVTLIAPESANTSGSTVASDSQAQALYPPSVERQDFFEPQKRIPAYQGNVTLFLRLPVSDAMPQNSRLRLSMLVCSARNCQPVDVDLPLPPADSASQAPADMLTLLRQARPGNAVNDHTAPPRADDTRMGDALVDDASPDAASEAAFPPELTPRYSAPGLEPGALVSALWMGLLAGLVLNVMPCVLPVLTIKITALLNAAGHGDRKSRLRFFREHNLFFAAGILTWFVCLALAVSLLDLAWGGLFQNVGVVYGLLVLVFLMGLSLFEVFTLPVLDFKVSGGSSPRMQAYVSGVVVTLLATPCSGPLLGGVLGFAASQPLHTVVLIFISTGLGMALPYLLLAAKPDAARFLPRPGAWNGVVERLAGFFLMATALYLLSVLPESLRFAALCALLVCALSAWIWGRWGSLQTLRRQLLVGVVCVGMAWGAITLSLRPAPAETDWVPFSTAQFNADMGNTPLLLEFTADWCPTCKVLERTVLTPERLHNLSATYGLKLVRVDMTRPHPAADVLLRALGSVSIPVTAIFPTGKDAAAPVVLRDLYTADDLEQAVKLAMEKP